MAVICSLYFYAYYKLEYLPIIITSILFNYTAGYFIQKDYSQRTKKIVLILAVIGNLSILSYYKYFNQIIDIINNFSFVSFDTMKLLLPLGISFFTFQQIGYITDLYKGEAKHTNIIDYALFVSFFPQLISGPICTFKELIPQLQDKAKKVFTPENIYSGAFLITVGLFKKVIMADNFNDFISDVINFQAMNEFYTSWIFSLAVTFRGYFDFSGYCDIALGLGLLFNIQLPINFNSPFLSKDLSDFWRRWHITMGRFLKYNVYIPMGGSRRGELRTYWNLLFVFFVTGLWHGATMPCIMYGLVNGVLVAVNKLWKKTNIIMHDKCAILITFTTLVFISPLVVIKDINQFYLATKTMLGINTIFIPVLISDYNFVFNNPQLKLNVILLFVSFIIVFCFKNSNELAPKYAKIRNIYTDLTLAVIFMILVLSITKGSEFIYFNF